VGEAAREQPKGMGLWFVLVCAVPFLMVLGNSMLFPIFPKLQSAISLSDLQTSMIVTAFSVPAGLLIPFAGYLSDRHGRKRIMAPSVAVFGAGALIAGLAITFLGRSAFAGIIAGRIVQGIGAAGMSQLAMALTADVFSGKARPKALGTVEASNGVGKIVSPIAGGVVGLFLWWLPFYIFAALALPLTILLLVAVKEPDTERSSDRLGVYVDKVKKVFDRKGRSLGALLFSGAIGLFILFGTLFYLSEVLEKMYRLPPVTVGFVLAMPVGAMTITSFLVGLYLQKRQKQAKTAVWVGLVVMAAVMTTLGIASSRPVLFASISAMGVGGGFVLPSLNLLITSSTEPEERGLITSLYGGVRFMGVALGPPVFGLLMRFGNRLLFWTAGGFVVVAALVALLLVEAGAMLQDRKDPDPGERTSIPRTPRGARVRVH